MFHEINKFPLIYDGNITLTKNLNQITNQTIVRILFSSAINNIVDKINVKNFFKY